MWKAFPKLALWKTIFFVFSIFVVTAFVLVFSRSIDDSLSWHNYFSLLKISSEVSVLFLCFLVFLSKWGWLILWKSPYLGKFLNESICPNLNGVWKGTIQSNFSNKEGEFLTKDVQMRIKADLLGVKIQLESSDDYQTSKVTHFDIHKDPKTEAFYLTYIYEGYIPVPKESDDRLYQGAAMLEIIDPSGNIKLKGTYWTNRAWQRKQNTAGVITLSKVNK